MSLYADYLAEREGKSVLEREDGFAVYHTIDWLPGTPAVYIQEIYVTPAARRHGTAALLADEIAELAMAQDIYLLVGSVDPRAAGANVSVRVLLAYGFALDSVGASGLVMFTKNLGD